MISLNSFRKFFILLFPVVFFVLSCNTQAPYVNNIDLARSMLSERRTETLRALEQEIKPQNLKKLVNLGMWKETQHYLDNAAPLSDALKLVQAKLYIQQHQYSKAENNVNAVLAANPNNRQAQLLRADLFIQAWNLAKADSIGQLLLDANSHDAKAGWIRGRVALLKREYAKALEWAQKIQDWNSENAAGYLLEAQIRFWAQDPAGAELALVHALELDPFNADARFSYGYAIWRRGDATQLDEMAAQWNLALSVNPLHYRTHWHFGNGHTNLTYADYAQPSDSVVQTLLVEADKSVAEEELKQAISITHRVEEEYSQSVIPAMNRGSIYYMYYSMDRAARLDSAGSIFQTILERKQNYGPAHNGLAAVIKQRQFRYLDGFEKLEQSIRNTQMPEQEVFYEVFPDLNYYTGNRVGKMVIQQIGPSRAYLPMIKALGRDFQIPPLHHNLAEAMENPYFLYGTTFDNRQWMDIRGVGSGAAGIEYIERGSHWERNVLAHEYAHLYHGSILTDQENRRIRALYHAAMVNNRTLDYYSANNESEFFAQAYAAFLSTKKVHPLTHKSMNTRAYLRQKDPALYAFIDSLVQKQKAYLAGNEHVFDSNWAQTYLTLSGQSNNPEGVMTYLDKALSYDKNYIPAQLAYARIQAEIGNFKEASKWISMAYDIDPTHAPAYSTEAYILHQRALQNKIDFDASIKKQVELFEQALELENDLAVRAQIYRTYRNRNHAYGRLPEAIEIAEQYLKDPPLVSTYLTDRKEAAEAFVKIMYSKIGYPKKAIDLFDELVAQNPQHFGFRLMYADVLIQADRLDDALKILQEGHRILAAAGNQRPDYILRIAQAFLMKGDRSKAQKWINRIINQELKLQEKLLLATLYAEMNKVGEARSVLTKVPEADVPVEKAALIYVNALLKEVDGDIDAAINGYTSVLKLDPYHLQARSAVIRLLKMVGNDNRAKIIRQKGNGLPIPPDPYYHP